MNFKILIVAFVFITSTIVSQNAMDATYKSIKNDVKKMYANSLLPDTWKSLNNYIIKIKNDSVSTTTINFLDTIAQTVFASNSKEYTLFLSEFFSRSIGKNSYLNTVSLSYLKKIKPQEFTDSAKFYLKNGLFFANNNIGSIAKVTAFACGNSCITDLQNALQKPTLSKYDKKDIKLALIRAGQLTNEQRLLQSAKEQVLNDKFVYSLMNDLTYTRSKPIFDYLLELIKRDEKNCTSANNDNPEPIICAYRIIENIAPYITNFPAKLNSSLELETTNYPLLLSEVRKWIDANQSTYTLNQSIY